MCSIVPILMGDPDPRVCRDLAVALDKLIGQRDDVLILISSDMSHYYTYDVANQHGCPDPAGDQGDQPQEIL